MFNVGEELVDTYLKEYCGCDFTDKNKKINVQGKQGEIDVIGINSEDKHVYFAEVAIHTAGLQYVTRDGKIDNKERLIKKFEKAIHYANDKYKGYQKTFMLWSPVVRPTKTNMGDKELTDIKEIIFSIKDRFDVDIKLYINEEFLNAIEQLRSIARDKTEELKNPILRLYQIEEISRKKYGHKQSAPTMSKPSHDVKPWHPKPGTIGATVKEYLESRQNPIYEDIREKVLSEFPDSAFNKNHFSWYKNHLSKTIKSRSVTPKQTRQPRQGTIKAAIMGYLIANPDPKYGEMKKIALSIRPKSAFNKSHFVWYINYFKKNK